MRGGRGWQKDRGLESGAGLLLRGQQEVLCLQRHMARLQHFSAVDEETALQAGQGTLQRPGRGFLEVAKRRAFSLGSPAQDQLSSVVGAGRGGMKNPSRKFLVLIFLIVFK